MAGFGVQRTRIRQRARFVVRIPAGSGNLPIRFMDCSAPTARVTVGRREHGGSLVAHEYPTGVVYDPVVLRAGRTGDVGLYGWFADALRVAAGVGGAQSGHERDVTIEELDNVTGAPGGSGLGRIVERWRLYGAWVSQYSPGSYDNASNEYLIESVTINYRYFERLTPKITNGVAILPVDPTLNRSVSHQGARRP